MLGNRTVIRYLRQHAILLTNVMSSEIIWMALTFMNAMCSCNLIMQGCYLWVWYWLPDLLLFYLQPVLWKGSFPYERWTCQYATYDCSRLLCVFYGYRFFFRGRDNLELMKPWYFLLLSHRTQFYFICPYCWQWWAEHCTTSKFWLFCDWILACLTSSLHYNNKDYDEHRAVFFYSTVSQG